jgi:N-carbamoyl-L-amino-acid hydrolase
MRPNLTPDVDLAARLFDALRETSFDGVGVTRDAYGPGEQRAHDIVRMVATELGLEIAIDPAGNMLMTLPGTDRTAKRIVLGSHLDSVPQGGNYDGAAGVLAGLATVAGMRRAGFVPGRDITVLAIRAEEAGAWFPTSYPGSHAALGRLPSAVLEVKRNDTGRSLGQHMREMGFDPDAVAGGKCLLPPASIAAYLELHIEQGPVLDMEKVPVAIVSGIPGSRRLRAARVVGEYNHSGATPRRYRADAAVALAELAYRLDEHWGALEAQGHQLVCTFCVLATTAEAGFTKIPGEACFQLDVRSVQPASVDAMFSELRRLIVAIEARRGVRFELGVETGSLPSPMDAAVQDGLARAAQAGGVAWRAMIFVRNQNGSHNPHEAMRMEDFAAGCAVMTRWAAEAAA